MTLKLSIAAAIAAAIPFLVPPLEATAETASQISPIEHARNVMPEIDAWLLKHPNDPKALYAKARASIALGDLAAAGEAYRKLVPLAPANPVLRLELATVEQSLGNLKAARSAFEAVSRTNGLPAEVKGKIDNRLAQIDKATQVHSFSGRVTTGLRLQENANGGPDSRFVEFWGLDFTMDEKSMPKSDLTGSLSTQLTYSYRMNDRGDRFGVQLSAFTLQPSKLDENRRDGVELRFGPSFGLKDLGVNGSFSAHAVISQAYLEGKSYLQAEGVQMRFNASLNPRNMISLSYGHRQEDYKNSASRTKAEDRNGHRNDVTVIWQHLLRPDLLLSLGLGLEDRKTIVDLYTSRETFANIGIAKRYNSPFSWSTGSWTTGAKISGSWLKADNPDPMINAAQAESTRELAAGLSQSIPLGEALTADIGVKAVKATSNYAISRWSDKSIDISFTYSF